MSAHGFTDPGTGVFVQTAPTDRIRDPHDPLVNLAYHRWYAARELRTARREGWEQHVGCTYYTAKKRATRRPLGISQLAMIESAIRCDLACRDAVAAWRNAA